MIAESKYLRRCLLPVGQDTYFEKAVSFKANSTGRYFFPLCFLMGVLFNIKAAFSRII